MPAVTTTKTTKGKLVGKKIGSFYGGLIKGLTGIPMPKAKYQGFRDNESMARGSKIADFTGDVTGKIIKTAVTMGVGGAAGAAGGAGGAGGLSKMLGGGSGGFGKMLGDVGGKAGLGGDMMSGASELGTIGQKAANMIGKVNEFSPMLKGAGGMFDNKGKGVPASTNQNMGSPDVTSPATLKSNDLLSPEAPGVNLAEGGSTDGSGWILGGSGNPKADDIAGRASGMIIPAEFASSFLGSDDARRLKLNTIGVPQADGTKMGSYGRPFVNRTANLNNPHGTPVNVSHGEFLISNQKVKEAGALGIDLQKWAPNAKYPLKDGGKIPAVAKKMYSYGYNDGSLQLQYPRPKSQFGFDRPELRFGNSYKQLSRMSGSGTKSRMNLGGLYGSPDLAGLYQVTTPTEFEKLENQFRRMGNLNTGYDATVTASLLLKNMLSKPGKLPFKMVNMPQMYNTELDDQQMRNDAESGYQTALYQARGMGVNPYHILPAAFNQKLRQMGEIGLHKANYRNQMQNRNVDVKNKFGQDVADAMYEGLMKNKLYRDEFYRGKADKNEQLLSTGSQIIENRRQGIVDQATMKYILKELQS